eukprot:Opistho-2@52707
MASTFVPTNFFPPRQLNKNGSRGVGMWAKTTTAATATTTPYTVRQRQRDQKRFEASLGRPQDKLTVGKGTDDADTRKDSSAVSTVGDSDRGVSWLLDGYYMLRACHVQDPDDAYRCKINQRSLRAVVEEDLQHFRNLTMLEANENSLQLGPLGALPAVEIMRLAFNGITDIVIAQGSFQRLASLDLSYNTLSLDALLALSELPRLESLDLTANGLSSLPAFKHSVPFFSRLTSLVLDRNSLVEEDAFCVLAPLPLLEKLSIRENQIARVLWPEPNRKLPWFNHLRSLDVANNQIATEDDLMGISVWPAIKEVIISGNALALAVKGLPLNLMYALVEERGISIIKLEPDANNRPRVHLAADKILKVKEEPLPPIARGHLQITFPSQESQEGGSSKSSMSNNSKSSVSDESDSNSDSSGSSSENSDGESDNSESSNGSDAKKKRSKKKKSKAAKIKAAKKGKPADKTTTSGKDAPATTTKSTLAPKGPTGGFFMTQVDEPASHGQHGTQSQSSSSAAVAAVTAEALSALDRSKAGAQTGVPATTMAIVPRRYIGYEALLTLDPEEGEARAVDLPTDTRGAVQALRYALARPLVFSDRPALAGYKKRMQLKRNGKESLASRTAARALSKTSPLVTSRLNKTPLVAQTLSRLGSMYEATASDSARRTSQAVGQDRRSSQYPPGDRRTSQYAGDRRTSQYAGTGDRRTSQLPGDRRASGAVGSGSGDRRTSTLPADGRRASQMPTDRRASSQVPRVTTTGAPVTTGGVRGLGAGEPPLLALAWPERRPSTVPSTPGPAGASRVAVRALASTLAELSVAPGYRAPYKESALQRARRAMAATRIKGNTKKVTVEAVVNAMNNRPTVEEGRLADVLAMPADSIDPKLSRGAARLLAKAQAEFDRVRSTTIGAAEKQMLGSMNVPELASLLVSRAGSVAQIRKQSVLTPVNAVTSVTSMTSVSMSSMGSPHPRGTSLAPLPEDGGMLRRASMSPDRKQSLSRMSSRSDSNAGESPSPGPGDRMRQLSRQYSTLMEH